MLVWAFWTEIEAAVQVWSGSRAFGHAFFIFPITLFLLYRLRHRLAALQPSPAPWAMVPIAGLSLIWMLGELANLMVVKQLAFVGLWQALFLLVLGWRVTRAALFPLAYLYLAVPFGYSVIPILQDVTAQMVVQMLRITGMPVFLDGYFIQIPSGSFLVAEACSGVRYLIVSVALGILAAYLFFRSWPRRLLFVGLSVVVPILANGIRAYGIVILAHLSDYRLAVDVDHVLYGFVFLGVVTLTLLGLATLLRDRYGAPEPAPAGPEGAAGQGGRRRRLTAHALPIQAIYGSIAIALVLFVQAWTAMAKEAPAETIATLYPPEAGASWTATDAAPPWAPRFHGNDVTLRRSYRLGDEQVDLHVAYYAYQREGAEAISDLNTLVGPGKEWQALHLTQTEAEVAGRTHPYFRMLIRSGDETYVLWYWYWIDGRNTNSRIFGKLLELKALVTGGTRAAAMIAIGSRVSEDVQRTDALLGAFLDQNLKSDGTLVRAERSRANPGTSVSP